MLNEIAQMCIYSNIMLQSYGDCKLLIFVIYTCHHKQKQLNKQRDIHRISENPVQLHQSMKKHNITTLRAAKNSFFHENYQAGCPLLTMAKIMIIFHDRRLNISFYFEFCLFSIKFEGTLVIQKIKVGYNIISKSNVSVIDFLFIDFRE